MFFLKGFKDDLSQAVNELLPGNGADTVDTLDNMVNTLDSEVLTNNEEAENQMKEWLDELTEEDVDIETQGENDLDLDFEVNNLKEDSSSDENFLDQANSYDEITDEEITIDEITDEEDNMEEDSITNDDINESDVDVNEEISYELMEDEDKLMGKKDNQNLDEILEENNELEFEDNDENVDLELLDALNAEEEEENNKPESKLRATSVLNEDEVTVISKGTTIDGNISSDGSLDVMGNITGDVECLGKLSITGKIIGNSTAAEVYVNTERLEGSINSEGSVKVGLGTVVVGDIVGTSGVIAGAVKGEIDINGPIVVDSTAIIKGNIKAKSVQINNGAIIEGFCSLSYSDVDVDNVFE